MIDAVVIGAGLSGLMAARRLVAAGAEVAVVEARDRVGGRTLTQTIAGARLDLGAQWIGPTQERMKALTRSLGIATFPTHEAGESVLELAGSISRYKGTIPRLPVIDLVRLELTIRRLERMVKQIPAGDPRGARDAAALDLLSLEAWKQREIGSLRARGLIDAAVRVIFGAEAGELSMLHFLGYLRGGGGLMPLISIEGGAQQDRFVEGAQAVSLRMAEALGARVRLSAPARRIAQDAEGVTVGTDAGDLRARRVIVAIPPPLCARIAFDPPLPGARDLLVQRASMGNTVKCHALYERPFWRARGLSGEVVSDAAAPLTVVFDNCSHDGSVAALLGFVVGRAAYGWSNRPEAARRQVVIEALARYFGPEALHPVAYVEQDWAEEPWTRGCPTANFGPGALTALGGGLRASVGRIHWAGTETAREWAGFMEGALEAGARAADEVLARAER